jgi:hypothetical protein
MNSLRGAEMQITSARLFIRHLFAPPKRSVTVPMMIIGFVAGVVTVIMIVRHFF